MVLVSEVPNLDSDAAELAIETLHYFKLQSAKVTISIPRYRLLVSMQKKIKSMHLLQAFCQNQELRADPTPRVLLRLLLCNNLNKTLGFYCSTLRCNLSG